MTWHLCSPVDRSIQRNFFSINNYSYEVALLPSIDQDSNSDVYEFVQDDESPVDDDDPESNLRYHDIALLKIVKKQTGIDKKMIQEHEKTLREVSILSSTIK